MSEPLLMSQNSVEQDENLAKLFCKTPETPVKAVHQTPRRSNRKRSLFQNNSPDYSDDLGVMSPLSASSTNSFQSNCSPYFSPNGKFSTPTRISNAASPKGMEENFYDRKIEIKSSLFPNVKVPAQKSQRKITTPVRQSPRLSAKNKKPESKDVDLPKNKIMTRSYSRKSRDKNFVTKKAEPNSLRASSNDIPAISNDIPEICSDIPEICSDIPEICSDIPDNCNVTPENSNDVPENSNDVPENSNDVPETSNNAPAIGSASAARSIISAASSSISAASSIISAASSIISAASSSISAASSSLSAASDSISAASDSISAASNSISAASNSISAASNSISAASNSISAASSSTSAAGSSTTPINSILGIREISSESFYGPTPPMPVRRPLLIDSLNTKLINKKKTSSVSKESSISNRSFVSGISQNKKRRTDTFNRSKNNKLAHQKGPHIGVWHGIKKPKKMKPAKNAKTSLLSPNSRVGRMADTSRNVNQNKSAQGKTRCFIDEKSRRRRALARKRNFGLSPNTDIIDPFPYHLVKRKLLPTSSHPSSETTYVEIPNPEKKFLKYGLGKKATFTFNENIKIQFSDGTMKMQSPKKKRRLYSGQNDIIFDFNDDDPENTNIMEDVDNIIVELDKDKTATLDKDKTATLDKDKTATLDKDKTSDMESEITSSHMIESINTDEVLNILEIPDERVNSNETEHQVFIEAEETQNEPRTKLIVDLGTFTIKEVKEIDLPLSSNIENVKVEEDMDREVTLIKNEITLLEEDEFLKDDFEGTSLKHEINTFNTEGESSQGKFYSLFYKQNWNASPVLKQHETVKTSSKRKAMMIPDDQYLLDAGQKSIGIITCTKCGVMYQAGDYADEATHKNFHNHLPELRFTGWMNERVVGKYLDGRIIMIVSSDPKSWWTKVTKIVDIVDQELGFPEGSTNAMLYKTIYLFVNEKAKQIVGCLIAEQCSVAYKMFPPIDGVEVDSCSKDPSPCRIGISRIWTALNHRRRGVAKRMIDCLRRTFIFGEIVPIDLVAFSVPSPSGKLLAQNVTGKQDFLVYGFA